LFKTGVVVLLYIGIYGS